MSAEGRSCPWRKDVHRNHLNCPFRTLVDLFVNAQSGVVHHASCGVGLRSPFVAEWTASSAHAEDRPCNICLPDGIPEDAKSVYSETTSPASDPGETAGARA